MDVSAPQILDAAKLIAAAGGTLVVIVQLAKMAAGGALTPRATVLVAAIGGFALTLLFALSNNLLQAKYAFDLVAAAFVVIATGAGIHSVATASSRPG